MGTAASVLLSAGFVMAKQHKSSAARSLQLFLSA